MKSYIFITGGAGGLGKAFAAECASRGWNVFLTDISEDALSQIAASLRRIYGIDVDYIVCDLTESEERNRLFNAIEARALRFWGLINVAGLDYEGSFLDKSKEQIRSIIRLNIEANLEVTHEVQRFRDETKTFRLINVASMAAYYPIPVKATYAASKRFLLNFSIALREEFKAFGGTVTALCPGGMPTTSLVIKSIDAQGFMGRVTTNNVGYVAYHTVNAALKGKPVYIPGFSNRILRFLGKFAPQTAIAKGLAARWAVAHKKSHGMVHVN